MYIPEFLCGVIATIIAEVLLAAACTAYDEWKKKDEKKEQVLHPDVSMSRLRREPVRSQGEEAHRKRTYKNPVLHVVQG